MVADQQADDFPERVSILGAAGRVAFVVKRTPEGQRHFVKVGGGWKCITARDFYFFVPNGRAEVRIFQYDPQRDCWWETLGFIDLWNPETN